MFDLASLTKPVIALTLARCERAGWLRRDEPLAELLPGLAQTASGPVSLDLLAAHRAGLEAHREFFVSQRGAAQPSCREVLVAAADARRPECTGPAPSEGFPPVYSDLGYMLLGAALAARSGLPLDELVDRQVVVPLGLGLGSARVLARRQRQVRGWLARVAPTEHVPWRGGRVRGIVHDENAWLLDGDGMAGHAGAFGDVRSVLALGVAVADARAGRAAHFLSPAQLMPLLRRRTGGALGAGFDRRSGATPSSGRRFGSATFGHLGFTGVSMWVDPAAELVGVLLTNRVWPDRCNEAIRLARPAAYDGIYEAMVAQL